MRLLIILFIIAPFFCKSQIWETDTMYIKHWQRQPDASIYFFEYNDFAGLLLDGNTLIGTDVFLLQKIKRIANIEIDTPAVFGFTVDSAAIFKFERMLLDTLFKNDTLLLPSSRLFNEVMYFRQYLPIQDKENQYLLVSFQLDRDNLTLTEEKWNRKNFEERSYKNYLLVNTRIFEAEALNQRKRTDTLFYVLFNMNTDMMEFFYVGKKMTD